MRQHRSFRPSFENLESRLNMSVVLGFDGSNRLASVSEDAAGQNGPVSMVVQTDGRISISEGANSLGTYAPARNLEISLGAVKPGLVNRLQLNNQTLKTNLSVRLDSPSGSPAPTQFLILGGTVDVAGEGTIDGHVRAEAGGRQSVLCVRRIRQGGPARGNGHRFAAGRYGTGRGELPERRTGCRRQCRPPVRNDGRRGSRHRTPACVGQRRCAQRKCVHDRGQHRRQSDL